MKFRSEIKDQKIRGDQKIKKRDQNVGIKEKWIPDLAKFDRWWKFSWLRNDHKLILQDIFHCS